jgi:hypothetical protein
VSRGITVPEKSPRWVGVSDAVIAATLLGLFIYVAIDALSWPLRSRLAPITLAVLGIVFCVLKLGQILVANVRSRREVALPVAVGAPSDTEVIIGDDEDDDPSLEYAFTRASRTAWLRSLGWVAAFFIAVWVIGIYPIIPIFSVLYLTIEGRVRWYWALLAAVITGGILYVGFGLLLNLQVPDGLLW